MSRKTSIPPKIILGDRGIQTYRSCDKGFADSMRLKTFKQILDGTGDARVVRESEFAKPYGEMYEDPHEDFWAMEYEAPGLPPWGWDYPGMEDPASVYHVTFLCGGDYCYCPDGNKDFDAECGWEIIGAEFKPPWGDVSVLFSGTSLLFTALETASGCGSLTITMRAKFKSGGKVQTVVGTHSNIQVCECIEADCPEEDICIDDSAVAWDSVNSPTTVARNNNVTVYITDSLGTGGPYDWSVSGSGTWSMGSSQTTGLSNTLICGSDACGVATITVEGCDGTIATGYVRCTTGGWTAPYYICDPYGGVCGFNTLCELIDGQHWTRTICGCCDQCPDSTPHPCGFPAGCTPLSVPWWNLHCRYANCTSVCTGLQRVTRHQIDRRDWQC